MSNKKLTTKQTDILIATLKERFEKNMHFHKEFEWQKIEEKLRDNPEKMWSLYKMEETGGEPDVISRNTEINEYIFCDTSIESPKGRRSLCYDQEALESRKKNKPKGSVIELVEEMGVTLLDEDQYYALQEMSEFDLKTSSWIETPDDIRELGGALFADRRYNHVFTYHNGAESYYAARGFRCLLRL